MEEITRIGMDTSKHVFQLHGVNAGEEPVLRKKLRRKEVAAFFEKLRRRWWRLKRAAARITGHGSGNHWGMR